METALTMVSHTASPAPHTEFLTSMTSHRVSYNDDTDDGYDEDYDEATAVTYSFTLEDNMPVVIQAVAGDEPNAGQARDDDNDVITTTEQTEEKEDVETEIEPIESRLVINFPAGNTITVNNKEICQQQKEEKSEDEVVQDIEEAEDNTGNTPEVQNENQEKQKKSKIFDILFSCFRFKCTKKSEKNKS